MAGSGRKKGQQELKNKAMLVVRNITKQEVTNVIFPNGITVGAVDGPFRNGFRVHGDAQVSGVVNAQGYRINGAPLEFGDPFLNLELDTPIVTYGSDNENESASQRHREFSPSHVQVTIQQGNQDATIQEGAASILDAFSDPVPTSSFVQFENDTGSSITTFQIDLPSGSIAPVFPITASISNEGIISTKLITKSIRSTEYYFSKHTATLDSSDWSFYRNHGILFVTQRGQLTPSTYGNSYDIVTGSLSIDDDDIQDGLSRVPTNFTVFSVHDSLFFRNFPRETMIHNFKGSFEFDVSSTFPTGEEITLIPCLYKTDADAEEFLLLKEYDSVTFTSSPTGSIINAGTDYSDSLEPTSLSQEGGVVLALFVSGTSGFQGSSPTTIITLNATGFLELGSI